MRRWLAALALVPVVAWGQGMSPQECVSERYKMEFTRIALAVMEHKESGISEAQAVRSSLGEGQASAIMLAAISHVYRSQSPSPDGVATAMAIACHDYARGR